MIPNLIRGLVMLVLLTLAGGCATTGNVDARDPFEGMNRSVFGFNKFMDKALFDPVGKVYKTVVPNPVDRSVTNFFGNLGEIVVIANGILQLKVGQAAEDVARFAVNSILGIGGLFDVATGMGLPGHDEDFGQTLGRWGVGPGPFLIAPFFGPTTIRDAVGFAVDSAFLNPVTYVDPDAYRGGLLALNYIDYTADNKSARSLVGEASFDEYEFLKNAYLERRQGKVRDNADMEMGPDPDID
jgi:phospholipid-binding lipoprotein MlaA